MQVPQLVAHARWRDELRCITENQKMSGEPTPNGHASSRQSGPQLNLGAHLHGGDVRKVGVQSPITL
jgi:hypothetical protein